MKATLINKYKESEGTYSFFFKPQNSFFFIPGQYLYLSLDNVVNDPRGNMRQFTISSSPKEEYIQITTEIHNASPFKQRLSSLKINDRVEIDGPMGTLTITQKSYKYIFLASGIAITPFRSIIETYKNDSKFTAELHHFLSSENKNIFIKEKRNWKNHKNITTFDEFDEIGLNNITFSNNSLVFICGSPSKVNFLFQQLVDKGINEDNIITEKFTGY